MDNAEVQELIYLSRCGSALAMRNIYAYYYRIMIKIAHRIYANQCRVMDYDDLIQIGTSIFKNVLCSYRLDGGAKFNTYASVCCTRRMQSAIKSQVRRLSYLSLDEQYKDSSRTLFDIVADGSGDYSPEGQCHKEEMKLCIRECLSHVSKRDRYIFEMVRMGYSEEEVSRRLHVPIKTVYNAMYRVSKKLKSSLSLEKRYMKKDVM